VDEMEYQFLQDLPPRLWSEMLSHFRTVDSPPVAERLWDEVLTPADKTVFPATPTEKRKETVAELWVSSRGGSIPRASVDILFELNMIDASRHTRLLRALGEEGEDSDDTVMLAAESTRLVVVDTPRTVYWDGNELPIKWDRRSALWECLLALCKATIRREAVDELPLMSERRRTLIDRKSKLKSLLLKAGVITLAECIVEKEHLLDLKPGDIRIFERMHQEEFKEWRPG